MAGFWRGLSGLQTIISVESSGGLPHCIHGVGGEEVKEGRGRGGAGGEGLRKVGREGEGESNLVF